MDSNIAQILLNKCVGEYIREHKPEEGQDSLEYFIKMATHISENTFFHEMDEWDIKDGIAKNKCKNCNATIELNATKEEMLKLGIPTTAISLMGVSDDLFYHVKAKASAFMR